MTSHQLDLFDQPVKQRTFHMKPCGKCGGTERYASSRNCIPCARERERLTRLADPETYRARARAYAASHRAEALARAMAWQKANPERRREIRERWKAANPEKDRQAKRDWKQENVEKVRAGTARYRSRGKTASPGWLKASGQYRHIHAFYRAARSEGHHVDHDIPLAGCRICGAIGLHVLANLRSIPASENQSKQDKCSQCYAAASR